MAFEPTKAIKGVWFWQEEWWWVIAINKVIARKQKFAPSDPVTVTASEVNEMLDELAGSVRKRLKAFAIFPIFVRIKGPRELIIKP